MLHTYITYITESVKFVHIICTRLRKYTSFIIFFMIFRARSLFDDEGRLFPASKALFRYSFLLSSGRPFHFSPTVLKTSALPPTLSSKKILLNLHFVRFYLHENPADLLWISMDIGLCQHATKSPSTVSNEAIFKKKCI